MLIYNDHIFLLIPYSFYYIIYFQFWGAEKETQQRLETAIFEDLNRYCWNQQQNTANISISTATNNSSNSTTSGPSLINGADGQVLIFNNRIK
jgi:hypothetical protein